MENANNKSPKTLAIVIIALMLVALSGIVVYQLLLRSNRTANNSQNYRAPEQNTQTNANNNSASTNNINNSTTSTAQVKIYLVALNDAGKSGKAIGCGDSAVSVTREIKATPAVLRASMEELLGVKTTDYGQSGLYNSLAGSNLTIDSINIDNNEATIKLLGELKINGTCDGPRIKAQLEETALQFPTVKKANFLINGKTLTSILSQEGA